MLNKKIEFIAHEDYFNLKEDYPTPIKLNIPEWFKKLNHNYNTHTVKGCIPFLDSLTSGYVLYMPIDFQITHNINNEKEIKDTFFKVGDFFQEHVNYSQINLNTMKPEVHPIFQLEGSPYVEKNKNLPFYKILNPWIIKTPPGYSCLFVPPLNNTDDRFSIIPAIVDTDTFPRHINFPIVINGDKYPILETVIKKSTPYVQIIPFKRDSWKMDIKKTTSKKIRKEGWSWGLTMLNVYKNKIWSKKSWR